MSHHDSGSSGFVFTKPDTAAACVQHMKPVSRCKKVGKPGHPPSSCGEHQSHWEGTFAGDAVRDAFPPAPPQFDGWTARRAISALQLFYCQYVWC